MAAAGDTTTSAAAAAAGAAAAVGGGAKNDPSFRTRTDGGGDSAPHSTVATIAAAIQRWFIDCAWPGLGLFGESYILFGIGTLRPIFEIIFPQCYREDENDDETDDDNYNNNNQSSSSICPTWIVQSMTYSVVVGVILGMIVVGLMANTIGRRSGSILTATLMSFGATMMSVVCMVFGGDDDNNNDSSSSSSSKYLFMSLSVLLFVFGIGVGGEYPLSASSASEKATMKEQEFKEQQQPQSDTNRRRRRRQQQKKDLTDDKSTPLMGVSMTPIQESVKDSSNDVDPRDLTDSEQMQQQQPPQPSQPLQQQQQHRGRQIQLVFTMQGMGIWVNSITLMILLSITGQTGSGGNNDDNDDGEYDDGRYDRNKLLLVSQITYMIGATVLLIVLITRYLFLQESQVWKQDKDRREKNDDTNMMIHEMKPTKTTMLSSPTTNDDIDNIGNNPTVQKTQNKNHRLSINVSPPGQLTRSGNDDEDDNNNEDDVIDHESTNGVAATTRAGNRNNNNTNNGDGGGGGGPFFAMEASLSSSLGPIEQQLSTPIVIQSSTISELSSPTIILQQEDYERQIMEDNSSFDADEEIKSSKFRLLVKNYGVRLLGASMSWLLWDISFYGNKLFQATFLLALTGEDTTLLEFAAAATLNSTVALLGYFGAAALIDRDDIGRVKLQTYGFLMTGALFVMCGFSFDQLSSSGLVVLYLASSFFGQLGPNATTFTIPAEIFPTEQRTLCHGICAACGKLGALIAAVLFHHVEHDADLFLISGYASFAACLISLWTIPETNGLDLLELDVKWRMTLEGRRGDYNGPANHPDHLSMYERWKKGASIQRHQMPNDWEEYVD